MVNGVTGVYGAHVVLHVVLVIGLIGVNVIHPDHNMEEGNVLDQIQNKKNAMKHLVQVSL